MIISRWYWIVSIVGITAGCAPIEYSVVVAEADEAVAEAEVAGAACTPEQLEKLSPVAKDTPVDPGTELASTEEEAPVIGEPTCDAPYEYYSAVEYLHKAREEVGTSDYEAAIEYARKARIFAKKARDIALNRDQERGR